MQGLYASSGNNPSYESEDLRRGLFTQAWLEALRGQGQDIVFEETLRGSVLTLSGLQFVVDAAVRQHAREDGERASLLRTCLPGFCFAVQPLRSIVPGALSLLFGATKNSAASSGAPVVSRQERSPILNVFFMGSRGRFCAITSTDFPPQRKQY